jgi:aspartyl-tRNA(Asn)/glutamyl-tRNA(Gln) amidotransferase subunit A
MTDLIRLTIAEARDEMKKGAFSSIELTDAYLAAIEAANPAINAYVKVTADKARDMAKASDARRAGGNGRRAGRHPARRQGSVRHRGRSHPGLLPRARRLRAALRIHRHRQSLGRWRGHARQAQHGRVRHGLVQRDLLLRPGDQPLARRGLQRKPGARRLFGWLGGCRCGALCAGATATDTGGSIRQPAAFTGTVGIKPTYGRCSRWGIAAFASSLDQAGPIARDVRDAAILLKSMASVDDKDTTSVDLPVP